MQVATINEHIKNILADGELEESSTIRNFRIVQSEGNRQVERDVRHYNFQMILAIGYRVRFDPLLYMGVLALDMERPNN